LCSLRSFAAIFLPALVSVWIFFQEGTVFWPQKSARNAEREHGTDGVGFLMFFPGGFFVLSAFFRGYLLPGVGFGMDFLPAERSSG
jgi:hypothetical protein